MISYLTLVIIIVVCAKDSIARSKSHFKSKSSIGKFYLIQISLIIFIITILFLLNLFVCLIYTKINDF